MSQYFPANRAIQIPELSRRITNSEYLDVVRLVERLGLENGWLQEIGAADNYQPDFEREGHPFESPVHNL
jgi:putative pyruvate formate lyase activating enzyme